MSTLMTAGLGNPKQKLVNAIARRILILAGRRAWLDEYREFRDFQKNLKQNPMIFEDAFAVRFILYPWDRARLPSLLNRELDKPEIKAITKLVNPGDVAFDVGANVGRYSVLLSRLCGPSGRIWSFEPVAETYWGLRETLTLNRCENVTPVQSAICEKTGLVEMNLFKPEFSEWNTRGKPSMITAQGERISPTQTRSLPCQTLDNFCQAQHIDRINFLKVDVEGFEHLVFAGAHMLLEERRVDYICFEISKEPLKGAGFESREVFEALERDGYSAYRFDEPTQSFQGPIHDTSEYWANFYASWQDLSKFAPVHVRDPANTSRDSGDRRS
jgi:FkbM family methyltransferase